MQALLKGYYGYQNLGDEILLFGVLEWIFANYQLEGLYIEVNNIMRTNNWINKNQHFFTLPWNKIHFMEKQNYLQVNNWDLIFLGGGEVITDQRQFPYNGRNYFLKYYKYIWLGKIIWLGGIGTPHNLISKLLLRLLLPSSPRIIVRDKVSYDIARNYNGKVELQSDFAHTVITNLKSNHEFNSTKKKLLINVNSYIYNSNIIIKIKNVIINEKPDQIYFVPCDLQDDINYYTKLKNHFPDLEIYNWSEHNIEEIILFFQEATGGIGARLHFLLILHWLNKKTIPLIYQEKITKFFNNS